MGLDAKKNEGARRLTAWKQPTGIPHVRLATYAVIIGMILGQANIQLLSYLLDSKSLVILRGKRSPLLTNGTLQLTLF